MAPVEGFLNLLKPPGITSHNAVAKVRRIFHTRAVGHAGTLDPAASGVLPLAIGRATRLLEYLTDQSKTYIGEATFGLTTDTLDQCGQVVAESPATFALSDLQPAMDSFLGRQLQVPPAFSAVKHQGKPLYHYARQGEIIQKPGREIEVREFTLLAAEDGPLPRCLFRLDCSKGSYVRVLVQDLAAKLGTVATLTFLLRSRVGRLAVNEAYTLEELADVASSPALATCLLPPAFALSHLPAISLVDAAATGFVHGRAVSVQPDLSGSCAVYAGGRLLGVGEALAGTLRPRKVLALEEDICDDRDQ